MSTGDGALGFWAALREVYPATQEQRFWVHKTANVLNKMPKSLQSKAKSMLQDIWMADTREKANEAFDLFIETSEAKYPKAAERLTKDRDPKNWPKNSSIGSNLRCCVTRPTPPETPKSLHSNNIPLMR